MIRTSLQDALDGLVKDNLGLIEFFLNLHDAVCRLRILVFGDVLFQLGKVQRLVAVCPRAPADRIESAPNYIILAASALGVEEGRLTLDIG